MHCAPGLRCVCAGCCGLCAAGCASRPRLEIDRRPDENSGFHADDGWFLGGGQRLPRLAVGQPCPWRDCCGWALAAVLSARAEGAAGICRRYAFCPQSSVLCSRLHIYGRLHIDGKSHCARRAGNGRRKPTHHRQGSAIAAPRQTHMLRRPGGWHSQNPGDERPRHSPWVCKKTFGKTKTAEFVLPKVDFIPRQQLPRRKPRPQPGLP